MTLWSYFHSLFFKPSADQQEEADTKAILHSVGVAETREISFFVYAQDIDALVLSIKTYPNTSSVIVLCYQWKTKIYN